MLVGRSSWRCFWTVSNKVHVRSLNVSERQLYYFGVRSANSWASLSKRDFAALEDRLVTKVGAAVKDPVLESDLQSLGWIQRRVNVSNDGSLGLHLKLPTLLHPERTRLASEVEKASKDELQAIAQEKGFTNVPLDVSVETSAAPVVPIVARRPEEHDEVIKKLGPGLAKVAHFLAVYSCKVRLHTQ